MSEPTHKTYVIRRANDLLSIPEDRLPIFLMELGAGIAAVKATEKLMVAKIAYPKTPWFIRFILKRTLRKGMLDQFRWVDDGKFTADFQFTNGGKLRLSEDWLKEASTHAKK